MKQDGVNNGLRVRVTVVIVTYNSMHVIGQCLAALPGEVDVLLVDNASQDETISMAIEVRPDVRVIVNKENMGFGAAMNIGVRQVETEFMLLLNPDAILAPDAISKLVEKANLYSDAAIVVPVLYSPDGKQKTSYRLNVFKRERAPGRYIEPDGDLCVEFASGAVMLWRMTYMKSIGLFDENFFFTYEDDDLCMRTKAAGKSIIVTAHASGVHASGTSSPATVRLVLRKTRYVMTSRLYMEQKYNGLLAARKMAVTEAAKYFLRTFFYLPFLYKEGILRSYGRYVAAIQFLISTFKSNKRR